MYKRAKSFSILGNQKIILEIFNTKNNINQVPVAPACNPSYSGSRDQEGHSSKPAQADSS
jgi:hypothetical protein